MLEHNEHCGPEIFKSGYVLNLLVEFFLSQGGQGEV